MAYATVADMERRFGEVEMLRLSGLDGFPPETVDEARIAGALADAATLIDSYLRRRYRVPLHPAPDAIERAACMLARFDLALGGSREPVEQMRLARKEVVDWLAALAAGDAVLDGADTLPRAGGARVRDRERVFDSRTLKDW